MSEKTLFNHFCLLVSKLGGRLFRNNTGTAWQGEIIKLKNGDILIKNPRPIHFGLCKGSSDSIGFIPVKITYSHVGKTLPVFTAIEFKSKTGRLSTEQKNFNEMILSHNGISITANSALTQTELLDLVSSKLL